MSRREAVMHAATYKPGKTKLKGNYWMSEKLDGTRCYWDGGVSRGARTVDVPWANIYHPKTGELKAKIKPVATGLWSRYFNPIIAPDWFLNQLPCCPLDGEMWAGRGKYQLTRSIVGGDTSGPDWDKIRYAVYGAPDDNQVYRDGLIKGPQFQREICHADCVSFMTTQNCLVDYSSCRGTQTFTEELAFLRNALSDVEGVIDMHPQFLKTGSPEEITEGMEAELTRVVGLGGEGIIMRSDATTWQPKRLAGMLKFKPFIDSEATVTGFTSGRETDLGSKLRGLIGALVLDFKGKRLELSGLTNEERVFDTPIQSDYAHMNPGVEMPDWFQGKHFKVGDTITLRYRELSDAKIPKEARYWRHKC